jgi:hypothetical protein
VRWRLQVIVPLDMLAFMRVAAMRPSDFNLYQVVAEGKPVSLRNELDALRRLMLLFKRLLDSHPTSVQQDRHAPTPTPPRCFVRTRTQQQSRR